MSTRGVIAFENPDDKTCRAIYVHFDMYLDGAGLCLINHYTTPERVEQLLALLGRLAVDVNLAMIEKGEVSCAKIHRRSYAELEMCAQTEFAQHTHVETTVPTVLVA